MPRRKPTGFDSYTFSEDELKAATRLMPLQKQLYQTLAADSAIEKSLINLIQKIQFFLLNKLLIFMGK